MAANRRKAYILIVGTQQRMEVHHARRLVRHQRARFINGCVEIIQRREVAAHGPTLEIVARTVVDSGISSPWGAWGWQEPWVGRRSSVLMPV